MRKDIQLKDQQIELQDGQLNHCLKQRDDAWENLRKNNIDIGVNMDLNEHISEDDEEKPQEYESSDSESYDPAHKIAEARQYAFDKEIELRKVIRKKNAEIKTLQSDIKDEFERV